MFDFAWSELALIAVVALIVIGPKDLPRVLRTVGQWVRRARAIAREFQGSIEELVREADLDDVRKHIDQATRFDLTEEINKTVDPDGALQRSLAEPVLRDPAAEAAKPAPAAAEPAPEPAPEVTHKPVPEPAPEPAPEAGHAAERTASAADEARASPDKAPPPAVSSGGPG